MWLIRGAYLEGPCAWAPFESEFFVQIFNVKKILKLEHLKMST